MEDIFATGITAGQAGDTLTANTMADRAEDTPAFQARRGRINEVNENTNTQARQGRINEVELTEGTTRIPYAGEGVPKFIGNTPKPIDIS